MKRSERIMAAYATWGEQRGRDAGIWSPLMAPGFVFQTTLGTIPGTGFRERYSLEELGDYFETLDATFEMTAMAPAKFVEEDDTVVGLIEAEWANRATGKRFRCEVACVWTFEGDHAVGYREILDTASVARTLA